jgi:peptidoglycan hydrolase CwlO-like protein
MVNFKLLRDVLIIVISLILVVFSVNYAFEKYKKKDCISEDKLKEIRAEKQREIENKQKAIDSILFDLKINKEKIKGLSEMIDGINRANEKLKEELNRRKQDIKKMSNDELVEYWKNELKK